MPKHNGRWVLLLTAALAAGTLLAACSKDGGEPSGTAEPGEPAAKEKPKISSSIYDRGSVPAAEGTIESNRWTRWINENGPVTVTFTAIPRWESEQKLNTLFASGSAPDLLFEYSPRIRNTWYQQKQLLPLDELIEKFSTEYKEMLKKYPALKKAGMMSDGKLYYMGRLNEVIPNRAILIRKDWLDKLKLEVPKTTEELYQVAKAFAEQDPDGNGKRDTYGIAISQNSAQTLNQVFQDVGLVLRGGKIEYAWDGSVEKAKFIKRLYDEGIIDRDFLNDSKGEKARQDFVNGKLGIYPMLIGWRSFTNNEYKSLKQNVPTAEIIPIAYPESPAGAFNPTFANPVQMTAAVNRGAKNPEAVIRYVDFLVKPSTGRTLQFGLEGVHHQLDENGCPKIIDGEHKGEVGYMADATMLTTATVVLEGKCGAESEFNTAVPIEKAGLELLRQAKQVYFDLNRPYAEITLSEHMPQYPKDLQVTIGETMKSIGDIWLKAYVSGSEYTVEQALQDAKSVWEKGKGPEAQQWMQNWYDENKDTAFMPEDVYDVIRQQNNMK